jgi:hypothetical protein
MELPTKGVRASSLPEETLVLHLLPHNSTRNVNLLTPDNNLHALIRFIRHLPFLKKVVARVGTAYPLPSVNKASRH